MDENVYQANIANNLAPTSEGVTIPMGVKVTPRRKRYGWAKITLLCLTASFATSAGMYSLMGGKFDRALVERLRAAVIEPLAGNKDPISSAINDGSQDIIIAPGATVVASDQTGQPVSIMPGPLNSVPATKVQTVVGPQPAQQVVMVPASIPPMGTASGVQPSDEQARAQVRLAQMLQSGAILKQGESAVDWGKNNLGYVGKANKGDVIPGMDQVESAPEEWVDLDAENEGATARYVSLSGDIELGDGGIKVAGKPVILSGVMLPPPGTECKSSSGESYDCHEWAMSGVREYISGKSASCSVSEMGDHNYGICDVVLGEGNKAIDIASWMVSAGIALAHDDPAPSLYHDQEAAAKSRKAGMWEGTFEFNGRTQD